MSTDGSIAVKANGPYMVSGGVPLRTKEPLMSEHGEPLSWKTNAVTDEGVAYALCRCGHSGSKPLGDGSPKETGFSG